MSKIKKGNSLGRFGAGLLLFGLMLSCDLLNNSQDSKIVTTIQMLPDSLLIKDTLTAHPYLHGLFWKTYRRDTLIFVYDVPRDFSGNILVRMQGVDGTLENIFYLQVVNGNRSTTQMSLGSLNGVQNQGEYLIHVEYLRDGSGPAIFMQDIRVKFDFQVPNFRKEDIRFELSTPGLSWKRIERNNLVNGSNSNFANSLISSYRITTILDSGSINDSITYFADRCDGCPDFKITTHTTGFDTIFKSFNTFDSNIGYAPSQVPESLRVIDTIVVFDTTQFAFVYRSAQYLVVDSLDLLALPLFGEIHATYLRTEYFSFGSDSTFVVDGLPPVAHLRFSARPGTRLITEEYLTEFNGQQVNSLELFRRLHP